MFRTAILPIFRSFRLCNTAYGNVCCTQYVQYSLWYVVPNTLPVGDLVAELLRFHITDRQRIGYIIPQAVLYSQKLLKMGKVVARNMSS